MFKKIKLWQLIFMLCVNIHLMPSIEKPKKSKISIILNDSFSSRTPISDFMNDSATTINCLKRKHKRRSSLATKRYTKQIAAKKALDKHQMQEQKKRLAIAAIIAEGKRNTGLAITLGQLLSFREDLF